MASPVLVWDHKKPGENPNEVPARRGYWSEQINKGLARYKVFHEKGQQVQDRYRLERENHNYDIYQDRLNILYSSTETTKPSLYAQRPKVQAVKRHRDRENDTVTYATMLLEAIGQYGVEEVDFDGVMNNVVQDYLLPGMGQAWVRYEPDIRKRRKGGKEKAANDNAEENPDDYEEYLAFEGLGLDYVFYKDFLTGVARVWKEVPWVARRVYFDHKKAKARFGEEKASKLAYSFRPNDDGRDNRIVAGNGGDQAIIWEIWDKTNRKVIWYSDDFGDDVLEELDDPLKLQDFFPCPEPIRAVWTTTTFVPKAFYSQYRAQAEELDNLTQRIRYLTQALRVVGIYDGSQAGLARLLQGQGNMMIPIDSWAVYAQQGGMKGSIDFFPIKEIVDCLGSLLQQREVVKNEIYEITGFSDIVRGVSKASETLGAQQIKADWAGGRLRDMQKGVQRFCRDLIAIMTEIMSEHFSEATLALYAGFEPPEETPEERQAIAQYTAQMMQFQQTQQMGQLPGQPPAQPPQPPAPTQKQQALEMFTKVVKLLRSEKRRCAQIGIETDSTILPDEAKEREDRMQFLSSAGAFLQQAGPMALQYPDMRGLLGAILMFTIRTFRSSRPLEKEFEEFTKKLAEQPAMPPPGAEGGEGGSDPAAAQAQVQSEQIKAQAAAQEAAATDATKRYEIDKKAEIEMAKITAESEYKKADSALREREVRVKEAELGIQQQEVQVEAQLAQEDQEHRHDMDERGANREEIQLSFGQNNADRDFDAREKEAAQPA